MPTRIRFSSTILSVILIVFLTLPGFGQLRLPAIIGSNMVLQQEEKVPLWGWDKPGQKITITTSWEIL